MQEQFSRMKETFEKDIRKIREDKTALEIEVASLDKVGLLMLPHFHGYCSTIVPGALKLSMIDKKSDCEILLQHVYSQLVIFSSQSSSQTTDISK